MNKQTNKQTNEKQHTQIDFEQMKSKQLVLMFLFRFVWEFSFSMDIKEASNEAIKKLQEEFENMKKVDTKKFGFKAEIINGNLFQWRVRFFNFNPHSKLGQELLEYTLRHIKNIDQQKENIEPLDILFELKFPRDYPHSPPLFR
jgi:hypothetical protein